MFVTINNLYTKKFFKLQFDFAELLAKKHKISLQEAIFDHTAFYIRFLGFSDTEKPSTSSPDWQEIIKNIPSDYEQKIDYFYNKYLDYEKKKEQGKKLHISCFHYYYHEDKNQYELHFDPTDPEGNLGADRQEIRILELRKMFNDIKKENHIDAKFFVRTWLLNINAFNRLFPEKFSGTSILWPEKKTIDNAHWGQFVDRTGEIKQDLADKLISNVTNDFHEDVNLYFPLPARYAEMPVQILIEYYNTNS